VPRRVDEVQLVPLPGDADGLGLDGDAPFALELHGVEHLRAHLARRDRLGQLEDPVRERRLPVVDVRDDRKVADAALVHERRWYSRTSDANAAGLAAAPNAPHPWVGSVVPPPSRSRLPAVSCRPANDSVANRRRFGLGTSRRSTLGASELRRRPSQSRHGPRASARRRVTRFLRACRPGQARP
jgi:hypothetical protein